MNESDATERLVLRYLAEQRQIGHSAGERRSYVNRLDLRMFSKLRNQPAAAQTRSLVDRRFQPVRVLAGLDQMAFVVQELSFAESLLSAYCQRQLPALARRHYRGNLLQPSQSPGRSVHAF